MRVCGEFFDAGGRVWLIGGTQESAILAGAIAEANLFCTVSVTTESAKNLYPLTSGLRVWVGKLDAVTIAGFLRDEGISVILDASHPYAVDVSKLAISAANKYAIPYLRYERAGLDSSDFKLSQNEVFVKYFDSVESLVGGDFLRGKRVLLTLGYRCLSLFKGWQDECCLFVRILPSVMALQAALDAGFTPDRIMAMRLPVSWELERALWQQWQVSVVVTKASGMAGGEDIKRGVAKELGVDLITIQRPVIEYPKVTSDVNEAVSFCGLNCSKIWDYKGVLE